jgi:hypothetical protein
MLNHEESFKVTMKLLTNMVTKSNTFEITFEFLDEIFMGTLL